MKKWIKRLLSAATKGLEQKIDRQNKETEGQLKKIDLKAYRNGKAVTAIHETVKAEFRRRDIWALKAAEVKRLAEGRKIWVIKCPAPDNDCKYRWGDYSFCVTLGRYLEEQGFYVLIDCYEDWYCDAGADAVLVIRGLHSYHPDRRNEKCKYILWQVSHPGLVSEEEFSLYDLVYVNSVPYAKKLQEKLRIPVKPLLLCADTELFYPSEEPFRYHRVFVGNSRGVKRKVVSWCKANEIELDVWGNDWKELFEESKSVHFHDQIENSRLPEIYRASRTILNDHWDDMKEYGFVNNRIMEALCCGNPVLSDYCEAYEELFGDVLVFYKDEDDFRAKLRETEKNEEAIRRKVREFWPVLQEKYSFAARAVELKRDFEELCMTPEEKDG